MSQQRRRRLQATPAPRRAGEPNVLSNQATPNQLSTMGSAKRTPGAPNVPSSARAQPVRAAPASGRSTVGWPSTVPATRPTAPKEAEEAPRTRRLPSFGTLLFIAFVIYWLARALGSADFALPGQTTAPAQGGIVSGTVGVVTFGRGLDDACSLEQPGDSFERGAQVWWRAELTEAQGADVAVVVRAYRDEGRIDRYEIPPEPELGTWDVLCAGEPVRGYQTGAYRVEIWDAPEQTLLAVGGYTKVD